MNNTPEMISLIISDDHTVPRNEPQYIFSFEKDFALVSSVADERKLLAAATECKPLVIVTNIKMSYMYRPEACIKMQEKFPETPIILSSTYDSEDLVRQMREIGLRGYFF